MTVERLRASYKDPSGFIFFDNGRMLRQVNNCYRNDYDHLMGSGLYEKLVSAGFLISHGEVEAVKFEPAYKIIEPLKIPFVSYPYEWSFSQLKDAARLTLGIQKIALEFSMVLKDASAFNVQFLDGKPVLIDTLSFKRYENGRPWDAYRQFCEHFLAPLALSAYVDARLPRMSEIFIDGIDLGFAFKLLPLRAKMKPRLMFHLGMHAFAQKVAVGRGADSVRGKKQFGKMALEALVDDLQAAVNGIGSMGGKTVWTDYDAADCESYSGDSLKWKKALVNEFLETARPKAVVDIGANSGVFSRIAADLGMATVALDNDETVVEKNYLAVKRAGERRILPLVVDFANPSPALGFGNREREAFLSRANFDAALALALVHHLAIAKNISFAMLAESFAGICRHLIIEFVPKEDKRVQTILSCRKDIFDEYDQPHFEKEFGNFFDIRARKLIPGSLRTIYLMEIKKRE